MEPLKLMLILIVFLIGFAVCDVYRDVKLLNKKIIKFDKNPEDLTIYENYPVKVMKSPISGLGVFATRDIKKGEIIEECPCLNVAGDFQGQLPDYVFTSVKNPKTKYIIGLGYGSMYNHKDKPTAEWTVIDDYKMVIKALDNIPKGNEIFISYGDSYWASRLLEKI